MYTRCNSMLQMKRLALVSGGLILGIALWDWGNNELHPGQLAANLLDAVVQQRFQAINPEFNGTTRLYSPSRGAHKILLLPENPREAVLLSRVKAMGYRYKLGFYHIGAGYSRPGFSLLPGGATGYGYLANEEMRARIAAHAKTIKSGDRVDFQEGPWNVFVRPVCVQRASCTNCHQGAKQGQVMGAMVYFIRKPGSL